MNVRGIHAYIWTCEHEAGHEYYFSAGIDKPGRQQYVLGGAVYPEEDPNGDWDGDGLPNQWELDHNLDPESSDTTGAYGGDSINGGSDSNKIGDTELICNVYAFAAVSSDKELWRQDWAEESLQWGAWFPNCLEENPAAVAPFIPWTFYSTIPNSDVTKIAVNFSNPQADPPNDVLSTKL